MHKLTYNLIFDAFDEALSASKSETFETIEAAQERADQLEEEYYGHPAYDLGDFFIDDERYIAAKERAWHSSFYEYEERMTNPNHPANLAD
jgi:hypothetical protein